MKTAVFISLCFFNFFGKAQLPNQTTNTLHELKKLFKNKDKNISIPDSGTIDLSGHWKGTYEGYILNEVTARRQLISYEYDLHIFRFGANKYAGIAESKGYVPINTLTLHQKNLGTYMTAYVFIDNRDSLKGSQIKILEQLYLAEVNEPAWPLKNFTAKLISGDPKMRLTGKSTTEGYSGMELNMKKIEPQIDSIHYEILHDMFEPKLQIQDIKFISEKNDESYLGYMGKGKLSFYILNIGKGPVQSLALKMYFRNDDPLTISDFFFPGEVFMKPGGKRICTATLNVSDRILKDSVLLGIEVSFARQNYGVFDSTISIPVKQ
jgi:hypothetical protein